AGERWGDCETAPAWPGPASVGGLGAISGPPYKLGGHIGAPMSLIREVGGQARALGDGQRHLARLPLAHERHLHALPDAEHLHARDVIRMAADRRAADLGEDVAAAQILLALDDDREIAAAHAGAIGGRAVVDDLDEVSRRHRHAHDAAELVVHGSSL